MFGDMNAKVGSVEIGCVFGKWGVDGVNENGQNLVDVYARKGLYLPMRGMVNGSDHFSVVRKVNTREY